MTSGNKITYLLLIAPLSESPNFMQIILILCAFSSQHNTTAGNFDHSNFQQRYPTGPQQAMPFPPVNLNTLHMSVLQLPNTLKTYTFIEYAGL